ncbi:proline iminopeptidase-family hydrolase [Flavobacterium subsaxonicum]|nr:proline iminopeptidase-family hydrolase [Flavobacterium subsaxonicum]
MNDYKPLVSQQNVYRFKKQYPLKSFIKPLMGLALLLMLITAASCSKQEQATQHNKPDYYNIDTTKVQTGGIKMIPVTTGNKTYNVWTKRIGNNPKIKVLLLAGGPGIPHDYFEAFESFLPAEGIEFYYYDELGSGNSDKPNDTTRYNIASAVDEVEQVRKALQLNKGNFYLFGHSWGGLLAMEYAVKYQGNLKGLIVSNMTSSGKEFNRYVQQVLAKQIPPDAMARINELSAKNDYANPEYMELAMKHFYAQFVCRIPLEQWPEPLNRALSKLNQPYYNKLQGPSEFGLLGSLKDWDISSRLKEIYVPTLIIAAKYDEMDPQHLKWMSTEVKNGHYLYCANGSHLSMYDEQAFYMNGIIKFIKQVNNK